MSKAGAVTKTTIKVKNISTTTLASHETRSNKQDTIETFIASQYKWSAGHPTKASQPTANEFFFTKEMNNN